jgi:hypothetical protein
VPFRKTITINGQNRNTREYDRFLKMRQRCLNPSDKAYPDYGGRGIRICQGWATFEDFMGDVGSRPSAKYSLDRPDNDGHYSCGRCNECLRNKWPANWRWATDKEQCNNTRANVRITYDDKTLTLTEWAAAMGVSIGTLISRRSRGLSNEQILAPVKKRKQFKRVRRFRVES